MSVTVNDLLAWKVAGKRFPVLTAYDFPTARILSEAGIPVLLVGDSLAQVVLGHETTLPVTMEDMLRHAAAVVRGAGDALVVADMPFMSYQVSVEEGIRNAGRFLKEAGAHTVKIEGPDYGLVHALVERGIPVMTHLGLTPQSVNTMGGYRVQGRTDEAAERLLQQAAALEKAGSFAVVLEGMPADVAGRITAELGIPTIGIGAGPDCDGQVLVVHDMLGLSERSPKFAKRYADVGTIVSRAAREFASEVVDGSFPGPENTYS